MTYNRNEHPIATAFIAAIAISLAAITGCESRTDIARKPPLINVMRERGRRCRIGDEVDAELPQDARLTLVLQETRSDSLDVLIKSDITVCPDARLDKQKTGLLDTTLRGVYHAADKTVTLYDNGKSVGHLLRTEIDDRGAETLNKIADELASDQPPAGDIYAGLYRCGKGCNTIRWKKAGGWFGFDSATLAKNPQLVSTPPLQGREPAVERW